MTRKITALGATLLLLLAVVTFAGGAPTKQNEPAQAWWYSYCTAANMFGGRYCVKQCYAMERYWEPNCGQVVYSNLWNA